MLTKPYIMLFGSRNIHSTTKGFLVLSATPLEILFFFILSFKDLGFVTPHPSLPLAISNNTL